MILMNIALVLNGKKWSSVNNIFVSVTAHHNFHGLYSNFSWENLTDEVFKCTCTSFHGYLQITTLWRLDFDWLGRKNTDSPSIAFWLSAFLHNYYGHIKSHTNEHIEQLECSVWLKDGPVPCSNSYCSPPQCFIGNYPTKVVFGNP